MKNNIVVWLDFLKWNNMVWLVMVVPWLLGSLIGIWLLALASIDWKCSPCNKIGKKRDWVEILGFERDVR